MTDDWLQLADAYAANRNGYSRELYDAIADFGVRAGASILDVGCGTGIACQPFIAGGFTVTGLDASPSMLAKAKAHLPDAVFLEGTAEALPFPAERFDTVISAQSYHWFDRGKALSEANRVLRPGGIISIWWKHLMNRDPVAELRDQLFHELGEEPPASGLSGGFQEFYASEDFVDQRLRVIPWRTSMTLDTYLGYERSRRSSRMVLGARADRYFDLLRRRLNQRFGEDNPSIGLSYIQYLYLAKKR